MQVSIIIFFNLLCKGLMKEEICTVNVTLLLFGEEQLMFSEFSVWKKTSRGTSSFSPQSTVFTMPYSPVSQLSSKKMIPDFRSSKHSKYLNLCARPTALPDYFHIHNL